MAGYFRKICIKYRGILHWLRLRVEQLRGISCPPCLPGSVACAEWAVMRSGWPDCEPHQSNCKCGSECDLSHWMALMSQNDQSASVASCIFERIIAQNVEFSVLTTTTSITIKQMKPHIKPIISISHKSKTKAKYQAIRNNQFQVQTRAKYMTYILCPQNVHLFIFWITLSKIDRL